MRLQDKFIAQCLLGMVVLGSFAPGVGRAGSPSRQDSHSTLGRNMGVAARLLAHGSTVVPGAATRMAVPHFKATPARNSVVGLSGNGIGRPTSPKAVVGGPAVYDAKKAAVVNGSLMRRKH